MTLRRKCLISTLIVFTCTLVILYLLSRTILLGGFVKLEEQSARRNVERVLDALSNDLANLNSVAGDWAAWDDTYAFIENPGEDYIQSNLVNGTFTGLRLNLMLFINSSGQLVFGKAYDLENGEEIPVPQSLLEHLSADCPFLRHPDPKSSLTGILLLPEGPFLLASRPIVTSKYEGPVRGTLVVGRYLDPTEIKHLAEITHLSLTLHRYDEAQMPPDFQVARSSLSEEAPIFVQTLSPESIAGYAWLKDVYGKPALLLRVDMPREIYSQGLASVSYSVSSQLLIALAFGAMTLMLLESQVLSRLARLSRSVRNIGAAGNLLARVEMEGKDELGSLANEINGMLESLERGEKELREAEARYRMLVEQLPAITYMVEFGQVNRTIYISPQVESLLGFSQAEWLADPELWIKQIHPEDRERVLAEVRRKDASGEPLDIEYRVLTRDGRVLWFRNKNTLVRDETGQIRFSHGVMLDITERKKAEEALAQEQYLLRTLIDNIPDSIYFKDTESRFIRINKAHAERWFGLSDPAEAVGKTDFDFFSEEHARKAYMDEQEIIRTGQPLVNIEEKETWPDGRVTWASTTKMPLYDAEGRIIGIFGISRDITERKKAEEALRESEEKYRTVVEHSLQALVIIQDFRIVFANNALAELSGYTVEELLALSPEEVQAMVHPEDRALVWGRFRARLEGKPVPPRYEYRGIRKDGTVRWLEMFASRIEYGGKPAVQAAIIDITEQKQAEEALKKSEQEKALILENVQELMVYQDMQMRILWANRAAAESVGLTPEQLVGRHCYEIWHQRSSPCEGCPVVKARETGQPQEGEITTPDGRVWYIRGYPVRGAKGEIEGVVEVTQEITARKEAEEEIRRLNQFLESIVDNANIWLNVLDRKHNVLFWNKAAEEISGYSRREVTGHDKVWEWLYPDENYRKQITVYVSSVIEGGKTSYDFETTIRCKDGQSRIISWNSRALMDEKGTPAGSIVIGRDITRQVQLEEQLRQSQKMEAVGRLAGGVAHDFNNLLTTIIGYSDFLLHRLSPEDPLRGDIEAIKKAGERAAALTRQLLAFSRKQMLQPSVLNLNTVVIDMEKMLRRLIGEDIELVTILEPGLKHVKADPAQMEQVIMNLVVNARDAMPEGGKLSIRTENVLVDEDYCRFVPEARPGQFVRLSIEDTGIGMDKEIRQHLFEPFFTTKPDGTGLGLSVVYGIVKQHEGWINVYSEPGRGSNFKVYLPAITAEPEGEPEKKISLEKLRGHGEKILVVEDDKGVREFAVKVLRENGYVVFEAADAQEALEVFEREGKDFHLLFSDVVLPDKTALQLIDQIFPLKPELKVLLCSGYADRKSQWPLIQERGFRFIQKPYAPADLLQVIKEAMAG